MNELAYEIPTEVVEEVDRALAMAVFWLEHLCEQLNIDPEMTKADIMAGTRKLAQVPLSQSLFQINEARGNLADAKQDSVATES